MAERRKWKWYERVELHAHLDYCRSPSDTPIEHMKKTAILCYLDGVDPQLYLEDKGVPGYQAKFAVRAAALFLNNERGKRRNQAAHILFERNRLKIANQFTSVNLRDKIDPTQDRNYGMVNVTIYCVVEVWELGEDHDAEKEYLVNFSDFKTKEWLTRLLVWALMNQREVHVMPASEYQMSNMMMFVPKDKVPA